MYIFDDRGVIFSISSMDGTNKRKAAKISELKKEQGTSLTPWRPMALMLGIRTKALVLD